MPFEEPRFETDEDSEGAQEVDQRLILEIVERANDRFLSRLDSLDTLLVGLLAASLAIGGLVVDRYSELGRGLWLLAIAYLVSVTGLVFGNLVSRPREAPNPEIAILGLNEQGEAALVELSQEVAKNWRASNWLAPLKIVMAASALALLTAGAVVSLAEKVIH